MNELTQKDIDSLDKVDHIFGCKLLLPPCNKRLNPFLDTKDFENKGGDIIFITAYLSRNGFSFFFNEEGFIEICGTNNIPRTDFPYEQNYSGQWGQL